MYFNRLWSEWILFINFLVSIDNLFFIIVAAETLPENVETKETLLEAATKEETEPLGTSHDTSEEIVADIPDPGNTHIFNCI